MVGPAQPNFFIVGAPKCGTTAMHEYLAQHHQIFMPDRKDVTHFGTDLTFQIPRITRSQYLELFREAGDTPRIGESSVWYMYSTRAAEEIKSFAPSARIIAMLRNPVDMLHSQHSQFLYNCNENIDDFEAALSAEEDRKLGRMIPPQAHFVQGLFYRETVKYAEQLRRFFDVFGRSNVHVVLFDEFQRDTANAYRATLQFLDVDTSFRPDFEVVNGNKTVRSRRLQKIVVSPPVALTEVYRRIVPRSAQGKLLDRVRRLNTNYTARPRLDGAVRRRLAADLRPEIERLEQLLDRDLSSWSSG
jgi:hypothetical protein